MLRPEVRLEWFVSFLGVIDTGSFSAAAEAVHRSQPRVSTHVAALEREAGVPLFDRSKRPVELTEAGTVLAEHARSILGALNSAEEAMAGRRGAARGVVTLGSYPSASAAFIPALLDRLARTSPDIKVALLERSTLELDTALHHGEIDVCLRPMAPPIGPSARSRPLWREPLCVVHTPEHPLAGLPDPLPVASVAEYPLITIGRLGSGEAPGFETYKVFRAHGFEVEAVQATNQPQTLVSLVRHHLGVGVTNKLAVFTADTSGVRVRRLAEGCGRRVAVLWDSNRPLKPAARTLLREICEAPLPPGAEQLVEAEQ
ncbi:LysR family transcriptional regulator [Streptomyces tubbatahanensis]|uniref:LysR family transcriptional regulator n=1 Tax=Streptomyces tubbatahanensis TaxID=2923272 RepID=A0ABY3XLQ4_9ACTN|nr:LysR family transcriptional regulator [Streptomyces tubbatahanensis]UNS95340.1 LysR family transcriptional regulator [Streptomyces tubbatahanensis]